jgi:hypothetical protein
MRRQRPSDDVTCRHPRAVDGVTSLDEANRVGHGPCDDDRVRSEDAEHRANRVRRRDRPASRRACRCGATAATAAHTLPSTPPTPSAPACKWVTETAPLNAFSGDLPVDVSESEDVAYNSVLQFLVTSGTTTIESQDPVAHTIVTAKLNGQTLLSTCSINHYFMYAFRIAIIGGRMIVNMACWDSMGWEGGVVNSVVTPRNRGELKPCDVPTYVGKNDALLPSMIFQSALETLKLRRMTRPEASPPPSAAEVRNARWWCSALGAGDAGSCYRSRDRCEKARSAMRDSGTAVTECRPRERATCFEMELLELGGTTQSCHPTIGACRGQLDYVRTKEAKTARVVNDCQAVE